jgi:hypothetical protein
MRRPIILTAILAAILLGALPGGAAANAVSDRIYTDCEHSPTGFLTGSYTKAQLRSALRNLPGDVSEYSGCYDAIRQALLDGGHAASAGGGGGHNGGGGGGPLGAEGGGGTGAGGGTSAAGGTTAGGQPAGGAPAPPHHTGTKAPVTLAGATIRPGVVPALGRDARALPASLIAFLVLLGGGALALVGTTVGRRGIARRRP